MFEDGSSMKCLEWCQRLPKYSCLPKAFGVQPLVSWAAQPMPALMSSLLMETHWRHSLGLTPSTSSPTSSLHSSELIYHQLWACLFLVSPSIRGPCWPYSHPKTQSRRVELNILWSRPFIIHWYNERDRCQSSYLCFYDLFRKHLWTMWIASIFFFYQLLIGALKW